MQKTKTDGEIRAEIYRNARLALTSIADILPETDDEEMRQEILSEHEEYERICAEAALLAKKRGAEVKEPSPVKRAMMWSAIKLNTAGDGSHSNIAQMMVRGTVTGITSLQTTLTENRHAIDGDAEAPLRRRTAAEERLDERVKNVK